MITRVYKSRFGFLFRSVAAILIFSLLEFSVAPVVSQAQVVSSLPAPNMLINPTPHFAPLLLKGIQIYPDNPLRFDFLVDKGDSRLSGENLKEETVRSIKYFLTSLTVPEKDMWVNLSPYERNRIAAAEFGQTVMGKDLLEQDYLLKQMTSTLLYPERDLGQDFWNKVYRKVHERFGRTDLPIEMLNRVWVVPQTADVFVHKNGAFVLSSKMEVMLESDYMAMQNQKDHVTPSSQTSAQNVYTEIVREVIIPEIRKEVNEGKTFASLRQAYNAMILATWYKRNLKRSLLSRIYVSQNKVNGVQNDDLAVKEKIYEQYLQSFVKGVYNYIREDYDPSTQEVITREYVSGGIELMKVPYREIRASSALADMTLSSDIMLASLGVGLRSGKTHLSFPDSRLPHALKDVYQAGGPVKVSSPLTARERKTYFSRLKGYLVTLSLFVATGLSTAIFAPNADAANFSINSEGNVIATVTQADAQKGFGGIVEQIQQKFQKEDPGNYAKSVFNGTHYWGANGLVAQVANGQAVDIIKVGQTFVIPQNLLSPATVQSLGDQNFSPILVSPDAPSLSAGSDQVQTGAVPAEPTLGGPSRKNVQQPLIVEMVNSLPRVLASAKTLKPAADPSPVLNSNPSVTEAVTPEAVNNYEIYTALPTLDEAKPYFGKPTGKKSWSQGQAKIEEARADNAPDAQALKSSGVDLLLSGFLIAWVSLRKFRIRREEKKEVVSASGEEGVLLSANGARTERLPQPATLAEAVFDTTDFGTAELEAQPPSDQEVALTGQMNDLIANGRTPEQAYQAIVAVNDTESDLDFEVPADTPAIPSDDELRRARAILAETEVLKTSVNEIATPAEPQTEDFGVPVQGDMIPSEIEVEAAQTILAAAATQPEEDFGVPPSEAEAPSAAEVEQAKQPQADFGVPSPNLDAPSADEIARAKKVLAMAQYQNAGSGSGFGTVPIGAAAFVPGGDNPVKRISFIPRWFVVALTYIGLGSLVAFALHQVGFISDVMAGVITACGNFLVIWVAKPGEENDPYPYWVRSGIARMLDILTLRGGESAGMVVWMQDKVTKLVRAIPVKVLKAKRGGDLVRKLDREFNAAVAAAKKAGLGIPEGRVFSVGGHVRLPTGGPSLLHAAHLFTTSVGLYGMWKSGNGNFQVDDQWVIENGVFVKSQKSNIVTIGANGDDLLTKEFDEWLPTPKFRDYYGELYQYELGPPVQWVKEPGEDGKIPEPHRIVPGDSPPIALKILTRLTQGNFKASMRYAYIYGVHKNTQEVVDNVITPENLAGFTAVVEGVFERHALKLSRPGSDRKDKTFAYLWATEEMAKKDSRWQIQVDALNEFREDLFQTLRALRDEKTDKHTPLGIALRHWKRTDDETLRKVAALIVERFFVGDQSRAVREFAAAEKGTFGVQVRNARNPNLVSLYSNNQGLSIGYNTKQKFVTVCSEHSAMMVEYGDRGMLDNIIFMDAEEPGQVADLRINPTGRLFDLNIYSFKLGRELTKEEILGDSFPQVESNPYFRKPLQYKDPDNIPTEDISSIPAGIAELQTQWKTPDSHNRQSGEAWVEKLLSRDLEYYIQEHSLVYGVMKGKFMDELARVIDNTIDVSTPNGRETKARILHYVENDRRILPYLKDYVDRLIAQKADELAKSILSGQETESDLPEAQERIEILIHTRFNEELKRIIGKITTHDFRALDAWLNTAREQSGQEGVIGAGEVDLLTIGYENSESLGHAVNELYRVVFPNLKTLALSSNKGLNLDGQDGVGRRTVARINTKSGATAPSQKAVSRLKHIMPDNVFVSTSRPDTLAAFALGQKYLSNSPFSQRIFYTGDYFPSEAVSAGEILALVNDLELLIYTAKRFREIYPHRQPFGMKITKDEIEELERIRDTMVASAEKLTGSDVKKGKMESSVHEVLLEKGKRIGKTILEGPANNLIFRIFVGLVYFFGKPLTALYVAIASWLAGGDVGNPTGLIGFVVTSLDLIMAYFFQWGVTTMFYRWFSERPTWARLTGLTMAINDPSIFIRKPEEMFAVKLGSMAPGSMHMHVLSTDPTDTTAGELSPRIGRGTLAVFGVPYDPVETAQVSLTTQQIRAISNGVIGNYMKAGAEIFTISRTDLPSTLTHHNMNIGAPDIKNPTPRVLEFYKYSFDMLERKIAYKVILDEAYRYATTFKVAKWTFSIWKRWKTYFRTGVLSTAIPVMSGKEVKVIDPEKDPFEDFSPQNPQPAVTTVPAKSGEMGIDSTVPPVENLPPPGGVDFDAKWLEMKTTGEGEAEFYLQNQNLETIPIDGVFPNTIQFIPLNPQGGIQQLLLGAQKEDVPSLQEG